MFGSGVGVLVYFGMLTALSGGLWLSVRQLIRSAENVKIHRTWAAVEREWAAVQLNRDQLWAELENRRYEIIAYVAKKDPTALPYLAEVLGSDQRSLEPAWIEDSEDPQQLSPGDLS